MLLVEVSSVAILALCAAVKLRQGGLRSFLREVALLAAAAWLAEDLCIRAYGLYAYGDGWSVRLDRVPLLIGAIWPFVILSAREVASSLWGESRWTALQAGALICLDAALVEPVAVRAGLWSWSEGAIFGVPLIGIAGWGVFGALCVWLLRGRRSWLVVPAAPLLANAALAALWWAAFRWGPRRQLPVWSAMLPAALGAALLLRTARAQRLPAEVLLPRGAAALLFFLLAARCGDAVLWGYSAIFAVAWAPLAVR